MVTRTLWERLFRVRVSTPRQEKFMAARLAGQLPRLAWRLWCSSSTRVCGALSTGANPVSRPFLLLNKKNYGKGIL